MSAAAQATNAEIAAAFDELAILYELEGAVKYRVQAYSTAAKAIRECPVSVAELARAGRATELPGVGKTLAEKIDLLLETGDIPSAVRLRAQFPTTLISVTRIPGLGAKTARRLFDELGISSLEDLKAAAEAQRIRSRAGAGGKGGGERAGGAGAPRRSRRQRRPAAALEGQAGGGGARHGATRHIRRQTASRSRARYGAGVRPARTST